MINQESSTQQAKGDAEIINSLENITYFNLEISESLTTLVFNASKKGIDVFLKMYGHLKFPPEMISFRELKRPFRKWLSPEIRENQHITPTDPTPYRASLNGYRWNYLIDVLRIQYLNQDSESPILCAGIRNDIPLLTVNRKGWQEFLTLVRCLRSKSYWFFVTSLNPSWRYLPFQLTTPYVGNPEDHMFKALEFIRLEPTEDIYLSTPLAYIRGNCTGFLLFSHWMHSFAVSEEMEKDICNRWNKLPEILGGKNKERRPDWVYLRKTRLDSPYPLFSFGTKEETESSDLYIFGNNKGFEEIAQIAEEYAFYSDHDEFYSSPPEKHRRGDAIKDGLGFEGFRWSSWALVGGAKFTPKYNPFRLKKGFAGPESSERIERNFVNERILLSNVSTD